MAKRKPATPAAPLPSAIIIPFLRSGVPPHRRVSTDSPGFNSGFEFAMNAVLELKKRGLLGWAK